jgi:hypothetical protein
MSFVEESTSHVVSDDEHVNVFRVDQSFQMSFWLPAL